MAFFLAKHEGGYINVGPFTTYEAASGEEIKAGEALVLSSGKLTKCGATTAPQYVSMTNLDKNATDRVINVNVVTKNQVWRAPCSADPSALKAGDKVTLSADALMVTATTTNGVVTVEKVDDQDDTVLCRLA